MYAPQTNKSRQNARDVDHSSLLLSLSRKRDGVSILGRGCLKTPRQSYLRSRLQTQHETLLTSLGADSDLLVSKLTSTKDSPSLEAISSGRFCVFTQPRPDADLSGTVVVRCPCWGKAGNLCLEARARSHYLEKPALALSELELCPFPQQVFPESITPTRERRDASWREFQY